MATHSIISSHPANKGALLTPRMSAILTSCGGGAIYGLGAGIIGGLSDPLMNEFFPTASSSDQSLYSGVLTACILVGAFLGCFAGVYVGNQYGRRMAFRFTGVNCIVMSILLAVIPTFPAIVILRTLLGLSVGFATALCPWYVTDAIPANVRGSIGTIFQINICGFILVAEIINYAFHPDASDTNKYEPPWQWKLQFAMTALPGLFVTVLSFIMHESPVYLQTLGGSAYENDDLINADARESTSDASLHHLSKPDVEQQYVESSSANSTVVEKQGWGVLFSGRNLKWVAVGLILSSSSQLTGINAVIFYAPKIFTDAGMSNPLVLTFAVVGTWNLLSVFISFALVDRLGRRPLMLGALFFMFLGAGLMSLAYEAFSEHKSVPAILAMILFIGAFECGPGPLFFIMAVDSFPEELRDPALSFTQSSCWVFSIAVTFGFPVVNDALGPAATFLIFACNCIISFVLIWWKIPEPHKSATPAVKDDSIQSSVDRERSSSISTANGEYRQL